MVRPERDQTSSFTLAVVPRFQDELSRGVALTRVRRCWSTAVPQRWLSAASCAAFKARAGRVSKQLSSVLQAASAFFYWQKNRALLRFTQLLEREI